MKRLIAPGIVAAALVLGLAGCTNPYDPGQRAVGGGLLGAGAGAAIGGAVGGGHGAALGAAIGGATGAVTGAATTPPVGAKVIALSVTSERTTASRQRPWYAQRATQSFQNCSVDDKARSTSIIAGALSCEAHQVSCIGTRSPFLTGKYADMRCPESSTATGMRSTRASGPDRKHTPSCVDSTNGTCSP